ncbi:hypothetical protein [Paracidovorax anthurii]|uniref:Uncharacterized protein n=1 Tax=Paracidovorax anthurii TaxID=78229 RepID=A0A328Z9L0_9BURK|nr:hypothetical protein [Paracidovorax anthurii]RAR81835.1 hypothetical protein AX018_101979 [Paracidovorax anthurii]WCM92160.1 hypothetical protein M5C99_17625 [Acidovorax sp. NCPPB 2350]
MATQTITTDLYLLFPSPRNTRRDVFAHQVFVPHPYALIHLPDYGLAGPASLFAACRHADNKMGQLATFEREEDARRFERLFTPD